MNPWESIISCNRVIALHRESMLRYQTGCEIYLPAVGCIERCLGNAWSALGYSEENKGYSLLFPSYLLFYLANNHCFVDGNKRVAWAVAMDIFQQSGLAVQASDDEAESFVLDIVSKKVKDGVQVASWFASRLIEG